MKKIVIISILLGLALSSWGQIVCGCVPEAPTGSSGPKADCNIANGGVFTPKGDIRILVVFISYGEPWDSEEVEGWPVDSPFPDWATNPNERPFYTSFDEFSSDVYSDRNRSSVSNFYYQMSNGQFRMVADYYPRKVVVNVDPNDHWGHIHRKALAQIADDVDWSRYDNRTNSPGYAFDNSQSQPDKVIDYIYFCHRYKNDWDKRLSSKIEERDVTGFAGVDFGSSAYLLPNTEYAVLPGFTQCAPKEPAGLLLAHECGHSLYEGPHYGGCNDVVADRFYMPAASYGMMRLSNSYTCAAGWERYLLDWTPSIRASGVDADIESASDLTADGIYTLRDFITTGDAIRIKVPTHDPDDQQYLWIENHQCKSTFDGSSQKNTFCNTPIDEYKKGVTAYVESYSHVKEHTDANYYKNNLKLKGNGIRWLSAKGNYDFECDYAEIYPQALCGNTATYRLHYRRDKKDNKPLWNPIGGQNVNESIRNDYNDDGYILYNPYDGGNGDKNEHTWVVALEDEEPTAKYFTGTGLQFQKGDKVGIARNPCVRNIPKYDRDRLHRKLGAFYLNGISFEIIDQKPDGSMVVKVKMDDVAIDHDTRWAAGSIVLTDITNDERPDVDVQPYITIDIDYSGTPNRTEAPVRHYVVAPESPFVTPTTFTCTENSYFKQEHSSTVNVKKLSTLVLEAGSVYEIEDNAMLNIQASATLHIKAGATLRVKGTGHVEIQRCANLCVEDGAIIELVDPQSTINLRYGCNNNCEEVASYTQQSLGFVHSFDRTNYIQDRTFPSGTIIGYDWQRVPRSYVEVGRVIKVGNNVAPPDLHQRTGDVVIPEDVPVIMYAEEKVELHPGFRVELGGSLEIRCNTTEIEEDLEDYCRQ